MAAAPAPDRLSAPTEPWFYDPKTGRTDWDRKIAYELDLATKHGWPIAYWAVKFPNAEARHAYARAYYRWINGDRSPTVRVALSGPDLSYLAALGADSCRATAQYLAHSTFALTWENYRTGTPLMGRDGGYGSSTTVRPAQLSATDPDAPSILENVARLVDIAGGRRDLPAAEWADHCGVTSARLSALLTAEAERWGLAVRRYRQGKDRTHMIEISRDRPAAGEG